MVKEHSGRVLAAVKGSNIKPYSAPATQLGLNCFVQTVRRQVFKHGIRVGSISPGPVISALLADWPPEKLKEAKESGSLLEASEVANVIMFMLTRPRGMTIRDVVMLPTNFDLLGRSFFPHTPFRLNSRLGDSGTDQGISGIGDQECQEPDRCDAGAGRSEKPGGIHRIAAAADQGRG